MIKKDIFIRSLVLLFYLGMVIVNALANIIPINNVTSGDVSDFYPNLFAPAGFAFSIWGLIYLLLGVYAVYQLVVLKGQNKNRDVLNKIGVYFIISSLANILWIFSWHYYIIWASLALIIIILLCLVKVADALKKAEFSIKEKSLVSLPFSVYFGWITVATIANITVLLVSLNWGAWGVSHQIWTVLILLIGSAVGIVRALKDKNIPYMLVFVWAYIGILVKHISERGFNGEYPVVITTLIICLVLFAFTKSYIFYKQRKLL